MKVFLPYGREQVAVDIPGYLSLTEIGPELVSHPTHTRASLRVALENPVNSEPLESLLEKARRIALLVSDITRSASAGVLRELLTIMQGYGVSRERIVVILATGMHRHLSDEELARHFGEDVLAEWRILQHDPRDKRGLISVGRSPADKPYEFSRLVAESDLAVVLGAVSFHYFAGYGGGRKLLLPGVAGEETILSNHRLALKDDPAEGLSDACRPGNLDGNPVHEDMLRGISALKTRLFSINYFLGSDGKPYFINAGDIVRSHREACNRFFELFSIHLRRRFKCAIISAGGHPKDINLLQAHKALRHISYALDDGALIFAALKCPEGVGSRSYIAAFADGQEKVGEKVRKRYELNSQTAISTVELARRFSIYIKSDIDESLLRRFGFLKWELGATAEILERCAEKEVLVVKDASLFLPEA